MYHLTNKEGLTHHNYTSKQEFLWLGQSISKSKAIVGFSPPAVVNIYPGPVVQERKVNQEQSGIIDSCGKPKSDPTDDRL